METFKGFGIAVGDATKQYLADDPTELAVATYRDLGLISDEGKAREEFGRATRDLHAALLESATTQPHDIVLVPKLGELGLGGLIERYDALTSQHGNPDTAVSNVWSLYTPEELNQGQTRPIEARAVLLGTDNDFKEPGLYFTGQKLGQQRKSLKSAQKEHDSKTTELSTVNPAGYIIRNAMQLERGEPLQDTLTHTRFPELNKRNVPGISRFSGASSSSGRLNLGGSSGYADGHGGVRLSAGQSS